MFPQPNQPNPRCCSGPLHQTIHGQSFHPIPPPSIHSIHIHIHPSIHLFAFSWFEGAETAPGPQTNGPLLGSEGPESCWGSAVSQPCPTRCFCGRIHGAAQGHGQSFHPIPPPSIHPSIHLSLNLAGSKVLKRPLVRKPMGHPFWVLLFRNRALGGVSAAASAVLPRPRPKLPPHSTPIHPSISLCF